MSNYDCGKGGEGTRAAREEFPLTPAAKSSIESGQTWGMIPTLSPRLARAVKRNDP